MKSDLQPSKMTSLELRSAISLALLFSIRLLGLFMILPVFTLYAHDLQGVTGFLIGLAIGIYGLTQALLQIPLAMLSDRIGRKPVITAGLIIFAIGSVVAALSDTIYGVIIGRALQGGGAIGAATIALVADLTREEHRSKAMAIIGLVIGASFSLAMIMGPMISAWFSARDIFWLTGILALLGIAIVWLVVPTPTKRIHWQDVESAPSQFISVIKNTELLRLFFGIFSLHLVLHAIFIVLPVTLHSSIGLDKAHHGYYYFAVLIIAFAAMLPFMIIAEKKRLLKPFFVGAIAVLIAAQLGMWEAHTSIVLITISLLLFFTGFNFLEANLPSLISRVAPADSKGTAMGIYSTAQFLGIFAGGVLGGWAYGHWYIYSLFIFTVLVTVVWLAIAIHMPHPRYVRSYVLNVGKMDDAAAERTSQELLALDGVLEASVVGDDGIAYLKIDRDKVEESDLQAFATSV